MRILSYRNMAPEIKRRMSVRQILLRDFNSCITCSLCRGYLIDATSLIDCLHVFCRACILRYFENFKLACPTCNTAYKKKNNPCFRSDTIIQSLVYKLVPGLYSKEVQRREDFHRSTGVRASSSCSEDSVLGEINEEHDEWMLSACGEENQYLSPDDAISLSLEYYKSHLDTTQNENSTTKSTNFQDSTTQSDNSANVCAEKTQDCDNNNVNASAGNENIENGKKTTSDISVDSKDNVECENATDFTEKQKGDRRFLQCPAAVTMSHLQKFLRMKHALSSEHRVDIIHLGEVLPQHFSLIDVAYTFKWKRSKPMRFFYRIFTPAKVQPLKIISTNSTCGKQLQVIPAKSSWMNNCQKPESTKEASIESDIEVQQDKNKERLMANLELQSKSKLLEKLKRQDRESKIVGTSDDDLDCIFQYEDPNKDEIRAFAEKRDREWALQKRLDEEKEKHRNSKKRKKNKHSKSNLLYKKRKLHAEITSSESLQKEECLKLKVKLTPHNGYKHKHHKSSHEPTLELPLKTPELSSKEKLLQMRQVRHKHIATEDKPKHSEETVKSKDTNEKANTTEIPIKLLEPRVKLVEIPTKQSESQETLHKSTQITEPLKSQINQVKEVISSGKTLRSDFSIKTNATKELCLQKYPTVQIERNEQTERHAQKTFLKTFQSYTEKCSQTSDKITKAAPITKSLELKLTNLHQQSTSVEPKPTLRPEPPKLDKKIPAQMMRSPAPVINSPYSSGFTVSKVETGIKRKLESDNNMNDKRPSLEITLINPSPSEKPKQPITKRPPPPTIPLDRIKKSMNRMPGISIIPKTLEKCDDTGALDLSKPSKSGDATPKTEIQTKLLNGLGIPTARPLERGVQTSDNKNIQLSNLQMLSKVATEHPNINKNPNMLAAKRPPIPNLQTLKIPMIQNAAVPKSNLAKLPKLNEISKTQFRLPNPLMRNMRPNQNQSIRNIPNPSLLVRQQNQNRLNSLNSTQKCTTASKEQPASKPNSSNPDSTKGDNKASTEEKANVAVNTENKIGS